MGKEQIQLRRRLSRTDTQDTPPFDVAAHVRRAANQSINTATPTAVSWDTEVEDTEGLWVAGTPTRFTIPLDARYAGYAYVLFADNGTGIREVTILVNGATILAKHNQDTIIGRACAISVPWERELVAGDYVEVVAEQTSIGALNITGRAAIHSCP